MGSARRDFLDHVIVFNERHLRRLLRDDVADSDADWVYTRLGDKPVGRPMENPPSPRIVNSSGFSEECPMTSITV